MGAAPSTQPPPPSSIPPPPSTDPRHARALEFAARAQGSAQDFLDPAQPHARELQGEIELAEARERASESTGRLLRALVPDSFEVKGDLRNERLRRANTLKNVRGVFPNVLARGEGLLLRATTAAAAAQGPIAFTSHRAAPSRSAYGASGRSSACACATRT